MRDLLLRYSNNLFFETLSKIFFITFIKLRSDSYIIKLFDMNILIISIIILYILL